MIIVEGADGMGKTQLCRRLSEEFKGEVLHSPGPTIDLSNWIMQYLTAPRGYSNSIFDRFFFSELIYGPVLRDGVMWDNETRSFMMGHLLAASPMIIFCMRSPDKAWDYVINSEHETKHEHDLIQQIEEQNFRAICESYITYSMALATLYPYHLVYDFDHLHEDVIVEHVANYLEEVHTL